MQTKKDASHLVTQILLGVMTVIVIPIIGWFIVDKLSGITEKQDRAFSVIAGGLISKGMIVAGVRF
ncbi:MAG: hypothetical protein ACHP6H_05375 [Legionellales bacterium]